MAKPKLTKEMETWIEAWRKSREPRPLIISHVISIAQRAQEEDFQYFVPLVEEVMRAWPAPAVQLKREPDNFGGGQLT